MKKPEKLTDIHLEYLDTLRESGTINMFAAVPHLKAEFPNLNKQDASKILKYWMDAYTKRQEDAKTN